MLDESEKSSNAVIRQRIYRERQRAEGFKQNTVWINIEAEMQGRMAAREGKPLLPMQSTHPASWAFGWINEVSRAR
ncbi:hypothetical protein [Pseudomonas avellanae]|uniref:hypothetical protein n=1 Tax=Pseudomonas avellanae TaxID=46257 RepID=UPI00041AF7F2|nr:hypothetical protein [Pseudomonas avellanae]